MGDKLDVLESIETKLDTLIALVAQLARESDADI